MLGPLCDILNAKSNTKKFVPLERTRMATGSYRPIIGLNTVKVFFNSISSSFRVWEV